MNEIMLNHYDNQAHGYVKISEYYLKGIGIDPKKVGSSYSFYNKWWSQIWGYAIP